MQRPNILRPFTLEEKASLGKWVTLLGPLALVTGLMLSALVSLLQGPPPQLNLNTPMGSIPSAPPVVTSIGSTVPTTESLKTTSIVVVPQVKKPGPTSNITKPKPIAPLPTSTKITPQAPLPSTKVVTPSLPLATTKPTPSPQLSTPNTGLVTLPPSPTVSSD